ncbi:unnamed protein product [Leptidea sinapis]|uniref:Ricin B lectin domain-containing protein n=1 Tax=Leptidea sinapis TaxID=189913 RepID=A0A5E4QUY7_9NEOP|nr:unnamed protein product [Leptidea sinapis]
MASDDTLQREGEGVALGAYPCHERLEPTQYFALTSRHAGQLRDEEKCAELQRTQNELAEGVQRRRWRYTDDKQLRHVSSGLCLTSPAAARAPADLQATPCRSGAPDQRWLIDYNEDNGFRLTGESPARCCRTRTVRPRGAHGSTSTRNDATRRRRTNSSSGWSAP